MHRGRANSDDRPWSPGGMWIPYSMSGKIAAFWYRILVEPTEPRADTGATRCEAVTGRLSAVAVGRDRMGLRARHRLHGLSSLLPRCGYAGRRWRVRPRLPALRRARAELEHCCCQSGAPPPRFRRVLALVADRRAFATFRRPSLQTPHPAPDFLTADYFRAAAWCAAG